LVRQALLLNASFAEPDSTLLAVRQLLSPLQPLHAMLFWTNAQPSDAELDGSTAAHLPVSFVEMPRLGLNFEVSLGKGGLAVECVERAGFKVVTLAEMPLERRHALGRLLRGVQGFILLEDADGNLEVLVSVEVLVPVKVRGAPFHSGRVPAFMRGTPERGGWDRRSYFVYTVHFSETLLGIPSLAARLYLLQLKLHAHCYEDAYLLLDGVDLATGSRSSMEQAFIDAMVSSENFMGADSVAVALKFQWKRGDLDRTKAAYQSFVRVRGLISAALLPTQAEEEAMRKFVFGNDKALPDYVSGPLVAGRASAGAQAGTGLGKLWRIGSCFRLRAAAAAETILQLSDELMMTKKALESGAPSWAPRITDTSVTQDYYGAKLVLKWERALGSAEQWQRTSHYVITCVKEKASMKARAAGAVVIVWLSTPGTLTWEAAGPFAAEQGFALATRAQLAAHLEEHGGKPLFEKEAWTPVADVEQGWVAVGKLDAKKRLGKLQTQCGVNLAWAATDEMRTSRSMIAVVASSPLAEDKIVWLPTSGTTPWNRCMRLARQSGYYLPSKAQLVSYLQGNSVASSGALFAWEVFSPVWDIVNGWMCSSNPANSHRVSKLYEELQYVSLLCATCEDFFAFH